MEYNTDECLKYPFMHETFLRFYLQDKSKTREKFSIDILDKWIEVNPDVTGIDFVGDYPIEINEFCKHIRKKMNLLTLYNAFPEEHLPASIDLSNFDFITLGKKGYRHFYEVQLLREIDAQGNPLYGLEDITDEIKDKWQKLKQ